MILEQLRWEIEMHLERMPDVTLRDIGRKTHVKPSILKKIRAGEMFKIYVDDANQLAIFFGYPDFIKLMQSYGLDPLFQEYVHLIKRLPGKDWEEETYLHEKLKAVYAQETKKIDHFMRLILSVNDEIAAELYVTWKNGIPPTK